MSNPRNPHQPSQFDSESPSIMLVAVPAGFEVPPEVLDEIEITIANGDDDGDDGDDDVALAS